MNIHDYRKGFMDGAKADLDHAGELYIMGYSFDKILELICKDEQQKGNQMATISLTRKEAENKLIAAKIPRDMGGRYHILDVLEALGLLHIRQEAISIDVVDINPVCIKRHGKIVYEE